MSTARKIMPNYTYEEYLQWEGRWELIEGIPYAMSPAPSPRHQIISSNLLYLIKKALYDNQDCKCEALQPIDMLISRNTVFNPDLLIVCGPLDKQFIDFPPELVVEIISPSSFLKDTITKYDFYSEFGIRYYIIVNPDGELIHVHELGEDGKYHAKDDFTFEISSECRIKLDMASTWPSRT